MTARYSDAEYAAARRIGYAPILRSQVLKAAWVDDFRRIVAAGYIEQAKHYRSRAIRVLREAEKRSRDLNGRAEQHTRWAADARLVARAVAREQRRAARS